MKSTIAIIGGGPAAISFCEKMMEVLKIGTISTDVKITILEKSNVIGVGLPYSETEESFILNLPTEMMDSSSNNGSFSRWMESHYPEKVTRFPPRYYFGIYLQEKLRQCQKTASIIGSELEFFCNCEVLNIDYNKNGKFLIKTTLGNYESDYVILCTGHMLSNTYCELNNEVDYFNNPWNADIYNEINCAKDVAIIGTRLTAIDITLKLKAKNHTGKILLVSRHGFLPAVLSPYVPFYVLRYLTLERLSSLTQYGLKFLSLDDLLILFWKEINEAGGTNFYFEKIVKLNKTLKPLERLKREIAIAEQGSPPWQQVLFASYPIVSVVWNMLSLSDKKQFIDKYYSLYLTYLAAFPLENAKKMLSMLESGQLEVMDGFYRLLKEKNCFKLIFKNRTNRISNYVFNATGLGYSLTSSTLYRNMLNHHFIIPHPLGGIDINPKTLQVVSGSRGIHAKMFAIGEMTHGACLATTDMARVVAQVECVVTVIVAQAFIGHSKADPMQSLTGSMIFT